MPDQLATLAQTYAHAISSAVQQEYPNSLRHTMSGPDDLPLPHQLHPAFYGCFDWHSAVEMHWALVRMLRPNPGSFDTAPVFEVLDRHLTIDNLAVETEYFAGGRVWERPYGWGWLLALAAELRDWSAEPPQAASGDSAERVTGWQRAVDPFAERLAELCTAWLEKASYPTRDGGHMNTAFDLTRSLRYARQLADDGKPLLLQAITAAGRRWFAADTDYPVIYEPGGADFLSGALTEAELMAKILSPDEFADWFARFLPDPSALYTPAAVSDSADGLITHLHGLNLYRAHAFGVLAPVLGEAGAAARQAHLDAALPAVVGGDWMAEHWLAAYAVLALG